MYQLISILLFALNSRDLFTSLNAGASGKRLSLLENSSYSQRINISAVVAGSSAQQVLKVATPHAMGKRVVHEDSRVMASFGELFKSTISPCSVLHFCNHFRSTTTLSLV
jgi:hypothetical protein